MIIKSGKNYKFPIHDDTPNKLLSGVIYLYPEKNTGTLFYSDKKGSEKEIIDWKPNRAVFFTSRKEKLGTLLKETENQIELFLSTI